MKAKAWSYGPIFRALLPLQALLLFALCLSIAPAVRPAAAAIAANATAPVETYAPAPPPSSLPPSTPSASPVPPSKVPHFPEMLWTVPEPGLELGLSLLPESQGKGTEAVFVVVRVDPAVHQFSLGMASEEGHSFALADWSRKSGLRAGINANMYLPDNITSTGYMRRDAVVNNSKMGNKLGAFFVAGRKSESGPSADIIERDSPNWAERLKDYTIVVQNYRLMDGKGKVLWPAGGPLHSIAVVAKDDKGRIDFILSQEPLTADRFAHYLKAFPLSLSTAMYVEGGAQAGLFLRVDSRAESTASSTAMAGALSYNVPGGEIHVWKGRQSLLNTRGNPDAPVPNIIGVTDPVKPPSSSQ